MVNTGAVLFDHGKNAASTFVLQPDSLRRNLTPSPTLLPEVGNKASSMSTLQVNRVQDSVQKLQMAKATAPVGNPQPLASFKSLESWDGRVIEVDEKNRKFTAFVVSEKNPSQRESAEFTFDEISDDDKFLVKSGGMFYWSVGYQINEFGGRSTASVLRFKRIRHWTRKELELANERVVAYADWFVRGNDGLDNAASE